jgi:SAM-dependent methyltransferase
MVRGLPARLLGHVETRLRGRWPFLAYTVRVVRGLRGIHARECICCGYVGRFRASGMPPRFDAQCPRCQSLERHRLFTLACRDWSLFSTPGAVLHFAPEAAVRAYVQPRAEQYVTADISGDGVDRRENIEATSFADASFDVVISSHVFEHVDDRRAIAEMRRILRPSGLLLCMVPLIDGWSTTYENLSVVTPRERDLHFAQPDHVRYYGRDFRDRLGAGGFDVREYTAEGSAVAQYGLIRGEKIFAAAPR